MTASRLNLTGRWWGDYRYPGHIGPTTPFLAHIEEAGGRFSGTIIEPDEDGGPTLESRIEGWRQGTSVDFTKCYAADAPEGYEFPVDYVGRLSDDGSMINGIWSLLDMDGAFEMHREAAVSEEAALREGVSVSVVAR